MSFPRAWIESNGKRSMEGSNNVEEKIEKKSGNEMHICLHSINCEQSGIEVVLANAD